MQTYEYKARDKFGKSLTGVMNADDEAAVAAKLKDMGYTPISIKPEQKPEASFNILDRFRVKVKESEVNIFTRQLAALQKAGIPLLLSLRTLGAEAGNKNFQDIIVQIGRDIEAGLTLSSAMEKYPAVFGSLYIAAMRAAEASGTLSETLERLAQLGDYEEKINLRIKAATRYPIFVIIAIVIGFFVLTTLVVPRFAKIYGQFNTALPLPTRMLLWLNYAITHYWWLMAIMAAGGFYGLNKFIQTKKGRVLWDRIKLKIPVFGPLTLKLSMSRFSRVSGELLKSGVGLFEVLELAAEGAGNVVIAREIKGIKQGVAEGKGLSEPMKASGFFPSIVVQMVAVGEQSGKLDELLIHVSDYYDSQVEYTVENLTSLIEPLLIFVLGCAVLFMALGIFLPMWNLMHLFKK
jgi:MSHA biogenesis protein MshG